MAKLLCTVDADDSKFPQPSVLQSSHGAAQILSHPILVVDCVVHMLSDKRYAIHDVDGKVVGYIDKVGSRMKSSLGPEHPFTVKLVDLDGGLLLTIQRPTPLLRPQVEVFLPAEKDGEEGILIGGAREIPNMFVAKRRYDLYEKDDRDNPFGRIATKFHNFASPVTNRSDEVVASIDRKWQATHHQLFSHKRAYALRMDSSAVSDSKSKLDLGPPLTLDQRAIFLATAITIDIDFFTGNDSLY